MRLLPKLISIIAVSLLAACATTRSPQADEVTRAAVMQRVIELLHRYEQNDQAGVVAMLDKNQVTILGSAISEKITAPAQLQAMMTRDFSQWKTAKFSDIRDVDVRVSEDLATAYFMASFSPGGGGSIPIRFTTTWRKSGKEWLLTQSSNSVPEAR
jgi:hypothetical protein